MTSFKKNKILFILVHYSIAISFLLTAILPSPSFAQTFSAPTHLVPLSASFTPVILRGIKVYPDNPLKFDFIVDGGNTGLQGEALKPESEKLIKYFLASLTVPQDDLWVNLSPYEKDRIIPSALSQTDMGKDMLAQDYLLKQITASLIYPEGDTGKKFWEKIYKKAYEQFGTTNIPIDTFNKVWIMPEKAVVYEQADKAFVVESKLKVMLESDYLAQQKNTKAQDTLASQIVRDVVIPELENEVNNGKNFAQLRQIYNALILAYWFKAKLKTSILNKVYSDQSKVKGIDIAEKDIAQKIYGQYVDSFKQGVMNFIKVEHDQYTNKNIPRKYFAGGVIWNVSSCMQYVSTVSVRQAPQWVTSDTFNRVNYELKAVSAAIKSKSSSALAGAVEHFVDFDKVIERLKEIQGKQMGFELWRDDQGYVLKFTGQMFEDVESVNDYFNFPGRDELQSGTGMGGIGQVQGLNEKIFDGKTFADFTQGESVLLIGPGEDAFGERFLLQRYPGISEIVILDQDIHNIIQSYSALHAANNEWLKKVKYIRSSIRSFKAERSYKLIIATAVLVPEVYDHEYGRLINDIKKVSALLTPSGYLINDETHPELLSSNHRYFSGDFKYVAPGVYRNNSKWLFDWGKLKNIEELVEVKRKGIRQAMEEGVPVFAPTAKFIKEYYGHGVKFGVGSASELTEDNLVNLGLNKYFDVIVDGKKIGREGIPPKSSPEFFKAVAKRMGVDPAKCVVIDDSIENIKFAKQSGFGLVIGSDSGMDRRLEFAGADIVLKNMEGLSMDEIKVRLPDVQGIIFDSDGVITDTVPLYFEGTKSVLDDYFRFRALVFNEPFREFTERENKKYLLGKSAVGGLDDLLASRGIELKKTSSAISEDIAQGSFHPVFPVVDLSDFEKWEEADKLASQSTIYLSKDRKKVLKILDFFDPSMQNIFCAEFTGSTPKEEYRNGKYIIKVFSEASKIRDEYVIALARAINDLADEYKGPIKIVRPTVVRIKGKSLALLSERITGEYEAWLGLGLGTGRGVSYGEEKMKEFLDEAERITGDLVDRKMFEKFENFIEEKATHDLYSIDPINGYKVIIRFVAIEVLDILNELRGVSEKISLFKKPRDLTEADVRFLGKSLRTAQGETRKKIIQALKNITFFFPAEKRFNDLRDPAVAFLREAGVNLPIVKEIHLLAIRGKFTPEDLRRLASSPVNAVSSVMDHDKFKKALDGREFSWKANMGGEERTIKVRMKQQKGLEVSLVMLENASEILSPTQLVDFNTRPKSQQHPFLGSLGYVGAAVVPVNGKSSLWISVIQPSVGIRRIGARVFKETGIKSPLRVWPQQVIKEIISLAKEFGIEDVYVKTAKQAKEDTPWAFTNNDGDQEYYKRPVQWIKEKKTETVTVAIGVLFQDSLEKIAEATHIVVKDMLSSSVGNDAGDLKTGETLASINSRLSGLPNMDNPLPPGISVFDFTNPEGQLVVKAHAPNLFDPKWGTMVEAQWGRFVLLELDPGQKGTIVSVEHSVCTSVDIRAFREGKAVIGHAHLLPFPEDRPHEKGPLYEKYKTVLSYLTDPKLKLSDINIIVGVGTHSSGLPSYEEMKKEAEQKGIKVLEPIRRAERTSLSTVTTLKGVLFSDGTSSEETKIREWGAASSAVTEPLTIVIPETNVQSSLIPSIDFSKVDALSSRSDLEYGLLQVKMLPAAAQGVYDALINIFASDEMMAPYGKELANTLAKMKNGSVELLYLTGVITEKEKKIFSDKNADILKKLSKEETRDFLSRLHHLVASYENKLTASQMNKMLRRLVPLEMITYLRKHYDLPQGFVFEIVMGHPDFIRWLSKASLTIRSIQDKVYGERNARRIVADQGPDKTDAWILLAGVKVKEIEKKVGGPENAWRIVISKGLDKTDGWIANRQAEVDAFLKSGSELSVAWNKVMNAPSGTTSEDSTGTETRELNSRNPERQKMMENAVTILIADLPGLLEKIVDDKILKPSVPLSETLSREYFWGADNLAERLRKHLDETLSRESGEDVELFDSEFAALIGAGPSGVNSRMPKNKGIKKIIPQFEKNSAQRDTLTYIIRELIKKSGLSEEEIKKAEDRLLLIAAGKKHVSFGAKKKIIKRLTAVPQQAKKERPPTVSKEKEVKKVKDPKVKTPQSVDKDKKIKVARPPKKERIKKAAKPPKITVPDIGFYRPAGDAKGDISTEYFLEVFKQVFSRVVTQGNKKIGGYNGVLHMLSLKWGLIAVSKKVNVDKDRLAMCTKETQEPWRRKLAMDKIGKTLRELGLPEEMVNQYSALVDAESSEAQKIFNAKNRSSSAVGENRDAKTDEARGPSTIDDFVQEMGKLWPLAEQPISEEDSDLNNATDEFRRIRSHLIEQGYRVVHTSINKVDHIDAFNLVPSIFAKVSQTCYRFRENFTDHAKKDGVIAWALSRDGRKIFVAALDNGPGFPEKDGKPVIVINEKGQVRHDPKTPTDGNGQGLGLVNDVTSKLLIYTKGYVKDLKKDTLTPAPMFQGIDGAMFIAEILADSYIDDQGKTQYRPIIKDKAWKSGWPFRETAKSASSLTMFGTSSEPSTKKDFEGSSASPLGNVDVADTFRRIWKTGFKEVAQPSVPGVSVFHFIGKQLTPSTNSVFVAHDPDLGVVIKSHPGEFVLLELDPGKKGAIASFDHEQCTSLSVRARRGEKEVIGHYHMRPSYQEDFISRAGPLYDKYLTFLDYLADPKNGLTDVKIMMMTVGDRAFGLPSKKVMKAAAQEKGITFEDTNPIDLTSRVHTIATLGEVLFFHEPIGGHGQKWSINESAAKTGILDGWYKLEKLIEQQLKNRTEPLVIFLWGLPGSGKTTLARLIEEKGIAGVPADQIAVYWEEKQEISFFWGKPETMPQALRVYEKIPGTKIVIAEGYNAPDWFYKNKIKPDLSILIENIRDKNQKAIFDEEFSIYFSYPPEKHQWDLIINLQKNSPDDLATLQAFGKQSSPLKGDEQEPAVLRPKGVLGDSEGSRETKLDNRLGTSTPLRPSDFAKLQTADDFINLCRGREKLLWMPLRTYSPNAKKIMAELVSRLVREAVGKVGKRAGEELTFEDFMKIHHRLLDEKKDWLGGKNLLAITKPYFKEARATGKTSVICMLEDLGLIPKQKSALTIQTLDELTDLLKRRVYKYVPWKILIEGNLSYGKAIVLDILKRMAVAEGLGEDLTKLNRLDHFRNSLAYLNDESAGGLYKYYFEKYPSSRDLDGKKTIVSMLEDLGWFKKEVKTFYNVKTLDELTQMLKETGTQRIKWKVLIEQNPDGLQIIADILASVPGVSVDQQTGAVTGLTDARMRIPLPCLGGEGLNGLLDYYYRLLPGGFLEAIRDIPRKAMDQGEVLEQARKFTQGTLNKKLISSSTVAAGEERRSASAIKLAEDERRVLDKRFGKENVENAMEVLWAECVRDPVQEPEPKTINQQNYFKNQKAVRIAFLKLLAAMIEGKIKDQGGLREEIRKLHILLMEGSDGKTFYLSQGVIQEMEKIDVDYDELLDDPAKFILDKARIEMGDVFNNAAGLFRDEYFSKTGTLYDPSLARKTEERMRLLFENLQKFISSNKDYENDFEVIKEFYFNAMGPIFESRWIALPFVFANNSLFFNMVNTMARLLNLDGVPNGNLDIKMIRLKTDEAKKYTDEHFYAMFRDANPTVKWLSQSFSPRMTKNPASISSTAEGENIISSSVQLSGWDELHQREVKKFLVDDGDEYPIAQMSDFKSWKEGNENAGQSTVYLSKDGNFVLKIFNGYGAEEVHMMLIAEAIERLSKEYKGPVTVVVPILVYAYDKKDNSYVCALLSPKIEGIAFPDLPLSRRKEARAIVEKFVDEDKRITDGLEDARYRNCIFNEAAGRVYNIDPINMDSIMRRFFIYHTKWILGDGEDWKPEYLFKRPPEGITEDDLVRLKEMVIENPYGWGADAEGAIEDLQKNSALGFILPRVSVLYEEKDIATQRVHNRKMLNSLSFDEARVFLNASLSVIVSVPYAEYDLDLYFPNFIRDLEGYLFLNKTSPLLKNFVRGIREDMEKMREAFKSEGEGIYSERIAEIMKMLDDFWQNQINDSEKAKDSFAPLDDKKTASPLIKTPGGIDLKSANKIIKIKGQGVEFAIPPELQGIDLNFIQGVPLSEVEGFVPVIIDIVPVANIFQTMGLNAEEEQKIRQALEREPADKPKEIAYHS